MFRSVLLAVEKTPEMKISGVFLCLWLFYFPIIAFAECGSATTEVFQVIRVSDGDTLKLADGRSVRVLGINAPEITRGSKPGQPFGRESRAAAQTFVDASKGKVRLGFERETYDRYGRLLAHVYDNRGRSLAAAQLRAGMALHITVPPNTAQEKCLLAVERAARQKTLGVWRDKYWQPLPILFMRGDEKGFRLLRGRIAKVEINSAVWMEFEGKLVAKVAKKDWSRFGFKASDWVGFKGKSVELRGWIAPQQSSGSQKFKPLIVQLRSPSSIKIIAK